MIMKEKSNIKTSISCFDILAYGILLGFVCLVAFLYIHDVFYFDDVNYVSDFPAHFEGAMNSAGSGYSLNSFMIYCLYSIFHTKLAYVAFLVLLIVCTCLCNVYVAKLFMDKHAMVISNGKRLLLSLIPMLMCSIYVPHVYEHFYSTANFGGACWHNDTYIGMRMMSMLALVVFFKLKAHYLDSFTFREWIVLAVVLAITNAFKPNFILGFAPVAALTLLKDLVMNRRDRKRILRILAMGTSILASLVVILSQYMKLWGSSENSGESANGIGIEFDTFFLKGGNPFAKVLLGLLPVICVVLYSVYKKEMPGWYRFLLGMLIVNFLIHFTFVETGSRYYDGNFGWGLRNAVYLLNFGSLLQLLKFGTDMRKCEKKNSKERAIYLLTVLAFGASLICGVIYFLLIVRGGLPWGL